MVYPLKKMVVDYGIGGVFEVKVLEASSDTLGLKGVYRDGKMINTSVNFEHVHVAPDVFGVWWYEHEFRTLVMHIQNFSTRRVHAYVYSMVDNSLTTMTGTIIRLTMKKA